jgi:hypothetical protein
MKLTLIALVLSVVCCAQTTPATLPALSALTGPSSTCTFEAQDANGGLYVNCTAVDGTPQLSVLVTPAASGSVFGYAEIACLYSVESRRQVSIAMRTERQCEGARWIRACDHHERSAGS